MPAQRNTPERRGMLYARARDQRDRIGSLSAVGIPASINWRTGKPHEHRRAKAKRQRRISTDKSWPARRAA